MSQEYINQYKLEPTYFVSIVWEEILKSLTSGQFPQCPPCSSKDVTRLDTIMLHRDKNDNEFIYAYFAIFENLYKLTLIPFVEVNPDCSYKYNYTYSVLLVGDISDDSVLLDNILEK